jgi:hypothetical protein
VTTPRPTLGAAAVRRSLRRLTGGEMHSSAIGRHKEP